jgi:hypothetical protein
MAKLEQEEILFALPMRRVEFTGGVLPPINFNASPNENQPVTAQV